jgi:hypothetical protein
MTDAELATIRARVENARNNRFVMMALDCLREDVSPLIAEVERLRGAVAAEQTIILEEIRHRAKLHRNAGEWHEESLLSVLADWLDERKLAGK